VNYSRSASFSFLLTIQALACHKTAARAFCVPSAGRAQAERQAGRKGKARASQAGRTQSRTQAGQAGRAQGQAQSRTQGQGKPKGQGQAGRKPSLAKPETRKPDKARQSPSNPDQAIAVQGYGKARQGAGKPRQGAGKGKVGKALQGAGRLCRTSRKGKAQAKRASRKPEAQRARQAWRRLSSGRDFCAFFCPFSPVFRPHRVLLWAQGQARYRRTVNISGARLFLYGAAVNFGRGRLPLWARPYSGADGADLFGAEALGQTARK